MIGWHERYNWTYDQFKKVVITVLEIEGEQCVSLDVEHSDRKNMNDIIYWAKERGYQAEEMSGGDIIRVRRKTYFKR